MITYIPPRFPSTDPTTWSDHGAGFCGEDFGDFVLLAGWDDYVSLDIADRGAEIKWVVR